MDFQLSDEAQMLQDALRRLLATATNPWPEMVEMGIPAAMFPVSQGGIGGSGFDIALVFEELGRAGAVTPLMESCVLAGSVWAKTEPVSERLISGEIAVLADGLSLNGDKIAGQTAALPWGHLAEHVLTVIDQTLYHFPAAHTQRSPVTLGCGTPAARLRVDTRARRVGPAKLCTASAVTAQCAEALGLMETIQKMTLDYLRTRQQFGAPIGANQVLQHRMADLAIETEQCRSAVINLAGHLGTDQEPRHLHAAKHLIGKTARLVTEEAVQMHGGIGMTADYALAPLLRRLTAANHRFGSASDHLSAFAFGTA